MSRRWSTRGAAALLVAGSVLLSGCDFDGAYDLPLPGSPVDADSSYTVTAEFLDILNVVPRSPVKVDDVTVGEVTEVDRVGWHAKVTLRMRDDVDLPDNAVAEIRQVSLLGEKYIALDPPADAPATGRLSEGDNISLESTGRNPEVEEVLGALSFLLSGGGVGQLSTITEELNNAMSGRTDGLRDLLGSLESVIGTLDRQKGDIIDALDSLNSLSETLNQEKGVIQDALDVTGPAIAVLDDQHAELIRMLSSLDRLGVVGTRVIRSSKDDLLASLDDLQPVLSNLTAAGDKLAPGLNLLVSFPFPKEASEIVKGDYANTSIRADIDLTNLTEALGIDSVPILEDLLGVPGQVGDTVDDVLACLRSGRLTSKACRDVLASADLLPRLLEECAKKKNRSRPVCRVLSTLPGGGSGGSGDGPLPGLPNLPDLPSLPGLLGLSRLSTALSAGDQAQTQGGDPGRDRLLGGVS